MDASTGSQVASEELRQLEDAFGSALAGEGGRSVLLGLRIDRLEHWSEGVQRELAQAALGRMLAQRCQSASWLVQRVGSTWWVLVHGADAKQGLAMARELAQSGRDLAFEAAGKARRFSISCAMAYAGHASRPTVATCAAVVEEGLRVAAAGGGRRAVHSEVYSAFASSAARAPEPSFGATAVSPSRPEPLRQVELPRVPAPVAASTTAATAAAVAAQPSGRQPEQKSDAPLAAAGPAASPAASAAEAIVLHRRLTKLSHELEKAEAEIARLRAQVAREGEGLASIYREVQGLADDASSAHLKREMMARLFEANVALRALASDGERAKLPA